MRFYNPTKRFKETKLSLESIPFRFGPNKRQELTRLIYELSRIKNATPKSILQEALKDDNFQGAKQAFTHLKDFLLQQRFPESYKNKKGLGFYLPRINIDGKNAVIKNRLIDFYPEEIFVENKARDYKLAESIIGKFPLAKVKAIDSLKSYIRSQHRGSAVANYNKRTAKLFLVKERHDFLKSCPCSKGVIGCGYHILNLGFGCPYECSYCFLQCYANIPGVVIPLNIEDYLSVLDNFLKHTQQEVRIGTGEFTDSLALDYLTGYSKELVKFFSAKDNATLELKTKSNKIENILGLEHNSNTVVSWSLNPQPLIDTDEWQASALDERLTAAKKCCRSGYRVGFHFDPIVYSNNWQAHYRGLIDRLFQEIEPKDIAWISLGTFRFAPSLKTVIEQRFPESKILDQELVLDFDGKLRYAPQQRLYIYKKMYSWIRGYSRALLVYLCMEPKGIWQGVLARIKF